VIYAFFQSLRRRAKARRQEADRVETERQEAAMLEVRRQEAARLEAARREAAMLEARQQEAARIEAATREANRIEAEKQEVARNEIRHKVPSPNEGYVYLLKAGPYYKIGKSKDSDKRVKQIKLQLPYSVERVHEVKTNDMTELESRWHRRFREKRTNGEWFLLAVIDVKELALPRDIDRLKG